MPYERQDTHRTNIAKSFDYQFSGLAAVDLTDKAALHLEAVQMAPADKNRLALYAGADTAMDGGEVLHCYGCRFQIEFLYRDAKQFAGLTHCQARIEEKLHFHLNTALTAVLPAKAAHHLDKPAEQPGAFSMADKIFTWRSTDSQRISYQAVLISRATYCRTAERVVAGSVLVLNLF